MKNNPWQQSKTESKLSFKRAFIWILLSTVLISGTIALATLYYFHLQEIQIHDDRYNITIIEQMGKEQGLLRTSYLAEVLELAANTKTNLIGYKTDQARKKLLASPVINSAKVRKVKPNTLAIEYTIRTPLFRLIDFENAAIDEEGVVIPLKPFYDLQKLPEMYLGNLEDNIHWGTKVVSERMHVALQLLEELSIMAEFIELTLKRVDVSKMDSPSYGERQVVLICSEKDPSFQREKDVERNVLSDSWLVRLNTDDLRAQMDNFISLRAFLLRNDASFHPKIIDLRVPHLAFMKDFIHN